MKIRPYVFLIFFVVLGAFYGHIALCDDIKSSSSQESLYYYSQSDIPEVFFFPKGKAHWDGTKVTLKEWYLLTDLQKEKFIDEYIAKISKQYSGSVDIIFGDYLRAMNLFSYYSNDSVLNEPSTYVIDELLRQQGKLSQDNRPAESLSRRSSGKI